MTTHEVKLIVNVVPSMAGWRKDSPYRPFPCLRFCIDEAEVQDFQFWHAAESQPCIHFRAYRFLERHVHMSQVWSGCGDDSVAQ